MRVTLQSSTCDLEGLAKEGSVILLDPDLSKATGHHQMYCSSIKSAFEALGCQVRVFAASACPRRVVRMLNARRHFTSSLYSLPTKIGVSLAERWIIANHLLTNDLFKLPTFCSDDLIIVHTTGRDHALGLYAWYSSLPHPRPCILLQIVLPAEFRAGEAELELALSLMRSSIMPWLDFSSDRVLIGTDNRALAEQVHALVGAKPTILPMPVWNGELSIAYNDNRNDGLQMLLPGDPRSEKGIGVLMEAFMAEEIAGLPVKLVVQKSRAGALYGRMQNLLLLPVGIPYSEYINCIMRSDAILLPYDPQQYGARSSGIFVEAIGCGKPVLAISGTMMAREVQSLGNVGVVVSKVSVEDLIAGVQQLISQFDRLKTSARDVSASYREKHSAMAFAGKVIRWWKTGTLTS